MLKILSMLEGDSTVPVWALVENDDLLDLIRSKKTLDKAIEDYQQLLDFVNENW